MQFSTASVIQKLGFKSGHRCWILEGPASLEILITHLQDVSLEKDLAEYDIILSFHRDEDSLVRLKRDLIPKLAQNGMIWMFWPKKSSKVHSSLSRDSIRAYGLECGLVDIKIASLDETWSGLKMVIPRKDRKK